MFEPFARTVPDPRSARQEQFEAQGESLGRLPPPRVLLLECSVNLSTQSAQINKIYRLVWLPKTTCLAFKNNLSESWIIASDYVSERTPFIYVC